jgi:hypothetical protein
MKKYIFIVMAAIAFAGCDGLLDTNNYTESNTSNFPKNAADAEKMITAIYATLNQATANPASTYYYAAELVADDRMGGGGENDKETLALGHLLKASDSQWDAFWKMRYRGIARANAAIECLTDNKSFEDTKVRDQFLGEALYLRAFFYSELAEMFGSVPLIVSSTQETNAPKASADALYAQITSDLKKATEIMSNKKYNEFESGHATKWAAEALMARNFLFYTGFYKKDALPLVGGGSLSKTEVISMIDDCVANSGHDLVGDYRDLWPYTNEYTKNDYVYTKDSIGKDGNPLKWAGNENKETVFSVKYCNYAGWNDTYQMGYANQYILYFGLRNEKSGGNGQQATFPFGQGWGQGPVASTIWDEWTSSEPNDLRRKASILNVEDASEGVTYTFGGDKQMEECGLWNKKMIPVSYKTEVNGKTVAWPNTFWCAYATYDKSNNGNDMQGAHYQDLIYIRFADILLMQSELKGDATGMNRVRARAGLPGVPYTLENLQKERRHELCFEGRRWADIRRWGIVEKVFTIKNTLTVWNKGERVKMTDGGYVKRYKATNGFFPIPKSQIDLSNGVLEQNAGWTEQDANYSGWNF